MKKMLVFVFCCFLSGSAFAIPSAQVYGSPHRPHHHDSIIRANSRATTALFVAFGAVVIATIGTTIAIQASEYNQGQVRIARF